MTTTEVMINRLKDEAKSNPVWNAVAHVFALRQRARHQVTVAALSQRMRAEGFDWTDEQYADVLKLLSQCGIGRLEIDGKGRPVAIKDIRLTLQSIGKVVAGNADADIKPFHQRHKFGNVVDMNQSQPKVKEHVIRRRRGRKPRTYQTPNSKLILTVLVNDKPVNIPIPNGLTTDEIAKLISDLQS